MAELKGGNGYGVKKQYYGRLIASPEKKTIILTNGPYRDRERT